MSKRCTGCLQMLEPGMFTKRVKSADGLSLRCRPCASAQAKARYQVSKEATKARAAKWSKENREARRAISARWDERNAERKRQRGRDANKAARAANPEAARLAGRIAAQKRRHREAAADSAPSVAVVARMLRIANGRCTYCRGVFQRLTVDHFHPVSKGGSGQWWNIAPCCGPCNSSKRDADGPAWVQRKFGVQRLVEVVWQMESLSAARLP